MSNEVIKVDMPYIARGLIDGGHEIKVPKAEPLKELREDVCEDGKFECTTRPWGGGEKFRPPHFLLKSRGEMNEAHLKWMPERNKGEWVVMVAYEYQESSSELMAGWRGPYALNEGCYRKLLGAYDIPENALSFEEAIHAPPSRLEKISKNPSKIGWGPRNPISYVPETLHRASFLEES